MNPDVPLLDALIDPFRAVFMQRALIEVLLLAIPAGLLGTWVVTRRLAFVTHAVGHATFPALVVAVIAGWSLFATSLVAAVALGLALAWIAQRSELAGGAGVGIVLAAALAVGAVLVSDVADPGVRANTLLFGSLLAIGWDVVARTAVVAVIAIAATVVIGRGLTAVTFHRELASAEGRSGGTLDAVLMVLIAATVAAALAATGSLLAASLLLVPAATARMVATRVPTLHLTGIAIAAFDGVAGLWFAYRIDAPPGAGIAAVAAGVFVAVAAARSVITRRPRQMVAIPS